MPINVPRYWNLVALESEKDKGNNGRVEIWKCQLTTKELRFSWAWQGKR